MANERKVEIFTAGCPVCNDVVEMVQRIACDYCDVEVLDMNDARVAARAEALGVRRMPAVAVDGKLAACCTGGEVTEEALRAEGIGTPT